MPQLRIHFTDADLARTRLKPEIDLMWEIVGSVQLLQHAGGGPAFDGWRRRVRERVRRDGGLRAAVQTLVSVAPHAAYFPDFLTPAADEPGIDAGVEAVLATPARRLRAEVGRLHPAGSAQAWWLAGLARGKPSALRQLRQALRVYFRTFLEPHLPVVEAGLRTDCADRIRHYVHTGPEGLLGRLGPATSWQPPVLTVDYPVDRDLHLDGRGLVLIPGYFCVYHPVALADPRLRPVLVLPLRAESRLAAGGRDGDHVGALLGTTRAVLLRSAVTGGTTTELARRAAVTPATVSHHTSVLRSAGLITTERHENCATHLITPLGLAVLTAGSGGR